MSKYVKKCHVCGAVESQSDLVKCDYCGQYVCDDSYKCSDRAGFGGEFVYCTPCCKSMGKTDCSNCKTPEIDCWCDKAFSFVYGDCPMYRDTEPEEEDDDYANES